MKRIEVKQGDKYGELTVVREVESKGKRHVLCECSCGQQATICSVHDQSIERLFEQWCVSRRTQFESLRAELDFKSVWTAR